MDTADAKTMLVTKISSIIDIDLTQIITPKTGNPNTGYILFKLVYIIVALILIPVVIFL